MPWPFRKKARKITELRWQETSGVDHPANEEEGWAVIKSADPADDGRIYAIVDADPTDGDAGYLVAKGPPVPVTKSQKAKENDQMSDDYLPDQVAEIFQELPLQKQAVVREFLTRVMAEQDRLQKSASSEWLAELERYMSDYIRQLAAQDTGATDPVVGTQFKPGPKATLPHPGSLSSATKALVRKALERVVAGNVAQTTNAVDDMYGHHKSADETRREVFDRHGEPLAKRDAGGGKSNYVEQVDLTTDPVASAAAERERVRRMGPG